VLVFTEAVQFAGIESTETLKRAATLKGLVKETVNLAESPGVTDIPGKEQDSKDSWAAAVKPTLNCKDDVRACPTGSAFNCRLYVWSVAALSGEVTMTTKFAAWFALSSSSVTDSPVEVSTETVQPEGTKSAHTLNRIVTL
jgi:hypothetical protein